MGLQPLQEQNRRRNVMRPIEHDVLPDVASPAPKRSCKQWRERRTPSLPNLPSEPERVHALEKWAIVEGKLAWMRG